MLAKAEPREAFLPDFNNEAQLIEVGFHKGEDGKRYHNNREWYPNPLSENDVIYIFKKDANGIPIDTGFGPSHELSTMYVRTEDFDANRIKFIKAQEMTPGKIVSLKKCASGTFCILPVGTKLFTSEGIVEVKPGEIINIKEGQNSVHTSKMSDTPDMYKADPLNPASKQLFDLINEYKIKESKLTDAEKIAFQDRIADTFSRINRGQKLCEILGENEVAPKTLKEEYEIAAKIAKELDSKYISRIDVSDFNKAIEQAREILKEIYANPDLTPVQKEAAKMAVMIRLLPKTNAHQHLKGSLPKDITLDLAKQKGFTEEQIRTIEESYSKGENGYDNLNEFNDSYGKIGRPVSTPADYEYAIHGIIREAMKQGQLTTEIRCACDSLRNEKGEYLTPEKGAEAIIQAIKNVTKEYESQGLTPPKTSFVFLSYRGRDWDGSLESAVTQAKEAVKAATKHPDMKFGFDVAGPEDTGYGPKYFANAIKVIKDYNAKVESGKIQGEKIGITMHAGETPTFDGGRPGYLSVEEAIEMGVDRIGHGVQAITNPETMQKLKDSGITVEICGVCNIQSIPINTEGLLQHPIDKFIDNQIPVTICTDNDAICGTNVSKEYLQFLLTGHSNFMDWNNVKQSARDGIQSAFISKSDKINTTQILEDRINQIQKLVDDFNPQIKEKELQAQKRKADEETKRKADEEAKRKADEEAKRKADEEQDNLDIDVQVLSSTITESQLNTLRNLNKGRNEQIYLNEFGEPKNVISLGNGENLYVSDCLELNDRKFIVGYVQKGGEMKLRLFYRSKSEGARRSCPGERFDGGYSKGENILNSSYETTTRVLNELQHKFDNLPTQKASSNPITLEGTGYNILEPEMASEIKIDKLFNGLSNNTVDYIKGNTSAEVKDMYRRLGVGVDTSGMKIVEGKGYTYEHQYLGTIEVKVCRLNYNGKDLDFSFAKVKNDPQNRVRIEEVNYADAKVSSFGIYGKQINAAPLTGKPIDYAGQVPTDMRGDQRIGESSYIDIRDLYQDNPIIKKYKELSQVDNTYTSAA